MKIIKPSPELLNDMNRAELALERERETLEPVQNQISLTSLVVFLFISPRYLHFLKNIHGSTPEEYFDRGGPLIIGEQE